jgi:GNAT superfamily N-acetyltransferase
MLKILEDDWPACVPWVKFHMGLVQESLGPLPDIFVAKEGDEIVGGYAMSVKNILGSDQWGLWLSATYVVPQFRRQKLNASLIEDARRRGGSLGFDKLYLASEYESIQFYEKYGFRLVSPDVCTCGERTQMMEIATLTPNLGQSA